MPTYLILAVVATFVVVFLLVFVAMGGRSAETARLMEVTSAPLPSDRLLGKAGPQAKIDADQVAKFLSPIHKLIGSPEDSELSKRLASAGYRKASHAQIFAVVKVLMPVLFAVAAGLGFKNNIFFYVIISAAVGFLVPDLWLTHVVSARSNRIRLSLPDALDLLVICMEAGLGLDQAVVRVGQELKISHPQLSEEFLLVNLEQRAGKPRLEAWRHMADRSGVDSIRSFVQMLVQTERFGTPISKSLGIFADNLRVRRRQQAEEMAAKTTIKLIPPLVLFIFPSLFIVLLGPAIITIAHSLGQAFSAQ